MIAGIRRAILALPLSCSSRGVAQPGRAPGSGPGGRRFKSSLPDQSSQVIKVNFWICVYSRVVDSVDGRTREVNTETSCSLRQKGKADGRSAEIFFNQQ